MDTRLTRRSLCEATDENGSSVSQDLRAVYAGGLYQKVTDFRLGSTVHRYFIPGPFGRIVGVVQVADGQSTNTIRYFQRDHLNSVNGLLSSSGIEGWSFDAQGNRRGEDWVGPAPAVPAAINGVAFDFGFGGHEHLDTIGLVLMGARVYDPVIGRMLQADPLIPDMADGQAHNRYSYVLNNPLTYLDPTGYEPEDEVLELDPIEVTGSKERPAQSGVMQGSGFPASAGRGGGKGPLIIIKYRPIGSNITSYVRLTLDDSASSLVTNTVLTAIEQSGKYDAYGQFAIGTPGPFEGGIDGEVISDFERAMSTYTLQAEGASGFNPVDLPSVPQGLVDALTGFGDAAFKALTLGFGDLSDIRSGLGIDGGVDSDSDIYSYANFAGYAIGGAPLLLRSAAYLGGTKALGRLNQNRYLRIGPGVIGRKVGKTPYNYGPGRNIPMLRIGNKTPNNLNHLDLRVLGK